tara:strand:+ start:9524 stop:9736 length:213 start_codon:yes stop_codon:yes gene_type:complete
MAENKKEKNYSTARIYTEDLARLRIMAKHSGKTQISVLNQLIKFQWNNEFGEDEEVSVTGIESIGLSTPS